MDTGVLDSKNHHKSWHNRRAKCKNYLHHKIMCTYKKWQVIWAVEKDKHRDNERHLCWKYNMAKTRLPLLMEGKHMKMVKIQNGNSIIKL